MTEPTQQDVQHRVSNSFGDDLDSRAMVPDPAAVRAATEPLFNKKVMVVWAAAALALWFVVSFVVPIALQTARATAREAVRQAGKTSPDGRTTKIILPNGNVITITHDGPRGGPVVSVKPATQPEPPTAPRPATPAKH